MKLDSFQIEKYSILPEGHDFCLKIILTQTNAVLVAVIEVQLIQDKLWCIVTAWLKLEKGHVGGRVCHLPCSVGRNGWQLEIFFCTRDWAQVAILMKKCVIWHWDDTFHWDNTSVFLPWQPLMKLPFAPNAKNKGGAACFALNFQRTKELHSLVLHSHQDSGRPEVWIGLKKEAGSNEWTFPDGTAAPDTEGYPLPSTGTTNQEYCGSLDRTSGNLFRKACSAYLGIFICEKNFWRSVICYILPENSFDVEAHSGKNIWTGICWYLMLLLLPNFVCRRAVLCLRWRDILVLQEQVLKGPDCATEHQPEDNISWFYFHFVLCCG